MRGPVSARMSVLQVVGAGVGAVAGFFAGGQVLSGALIGASIGGAVGSVANSLVNPAQGTHTEGARLGDLTVQSSAFGAVRPIGYGKIRISGNVIWALPIQEHSSTTSTGGGKGSGPSNSTTSYTYGATFALALCEGPADAVMRIWADSKLVYDVRSGSDAVNRPGFNFRFYPGNGTQTADSIIEAAQGVGNVPGYRGTVYLVFDDIPLADYGNRIPNITVELTFNVTSVFDYGFLTGATSSLFGTPLYSGAVAINPSTHVGYLFADGSVGPTGIVEFNADTMTTTREILMSDVLTPLAIADTGGAVPGSSPMIDPGGALYFVTSDSVNGPDIIRVDPNVLRATASFPATSGSTFSDSDFQGTDQLCFLAYLDGSNTLVSQVVACNSANQVGGLNLPDLSFNWFRNDLTGSTSIGICQGKTASGVGEAYVMALGTVSSVTFWYISKISLGGSVAVDLISTYRASDFSASAFDFYAPGGQGGLIYDEADDSVVFHVSLIDGSSVPFSVTVKWSQSSGIIFATITPGDVLGEAISSPMSRISSGTYARLNLTTPTVTVIDASGGALISNDTWPVSLGGSASTQIYDSEFQVIVAYATDGAQSGWAKLRLGRFTSAGTTLAPIFLDQCERAGFLSSDVDVTGLTDPVDGFVVSQRAMVSDVLSPMMGAYLIDAAEIDGVLTFRHRGGFLNLNFYNGTWDPSTIEFQMVLSDDNLSASVFGSGVVFGKVRSVPPVEGDGLLFFAFGPGTVGADSLQAVGICNAAFNVLLENPGTNANSVAFFVPGSAIAGEIVFNNASIGVAGEAVQGDVCVLAIDTIRFLVWLSIDGGATWNAGGGTGGDPTTGAGGYSVAGLVGPFYAIADITSNAGALNSVAILPPSIFHVPVSIALVEDDLIRVDDATPVYMETRQQEIEMPMRVTFTYIDSDRDYQTNTQAAKRARHPNPTVQTDNQTDVNIAIVSQATPAKQAAERILASIWNERDSFAVRLAPKFSYLNATDGVRLTLDDGYVVSGRLGKADIGVDYSIDATIIAETAGQYVSAALADPGVPWAGNQTINIPLASKLILLDAPLLRDGDDLGGTAMRGYWAGASYGTSGGWPGAQLQASPDGATWTPNDSSADEVTWGAIETPPPDPASCWRTQFGATMTVQVTGGAYVPTATDDLGLANLANPMAVIKANGQVEIIQYRDVTPLGSGRYTLGTFYRGARGTDTMAGGLALGDIFVFLGTVGTRELTVPLAFHNISEFWRLVTNGLLSSSAIPQGFIFHGRDLMPYAPVLGAAALSGSDIVLTWVRRTRFGGELRDTIDTVPLNEETEAYEIDILDAPGGSVVRTLTAATSTVTYTAADITADFGSTPAALSVDIYQMSAVVGRGFATEELLTVA